MRLRRQFCAIALMGVISLSLHAAADAISGDWNASFDVQGNAVPLVLKLKLAGTKVTGTSESDHVGPGTITNGSFTAGKLSFTLESAHGTLSVTGLLKDGALSGEFSGGQGMQGKWEAKKKAAEPEKH